ncbi:MAG: hypothetical protein QW590_03560 [Candidatus Bilamarchaeaceae archaeon]
MEDKKDIKKITEKTIAEGGVLALLYFDIHAATKEDVQNLGAGFIQHIIYTPGVVYALGEIDEPIAGGEGKNYSSSIELKVLTKNFSTLANICLTHSPFSIEILRPNDIRFSLSEAHELLALLSATTADYKRLILTKLAKPEEIAELQRQLVFRAEAGKKLLEKKG